MCQTQLRLPNLAGHETVSAQCLPKRPRSKCNITYTQVLVAITRVVVLMYRQHNS